MPESTSTNDNAQEGGAETPTSSQPQSSSQGTRLCQLDNRKEKRQTSITPRKFNRFFSPRSLGRLPIKLPRDALEDITAPANNRSGTQSSPIRYFSRGHGIENSPVTFTRETKRRKLLHALSPSCNNSSFEKHLLFDLDAPESSLPNDPDNSWPSEYFTSAEDDLRKPQKPDLSPLTMTTDQIRQVGTRGLAGRLLKLSLGSGASCKGQNFSYPVSDWRDHTAGFHSGPHDIHFCTSIESSVRSIPFCAASCNTNSLVAIGDEEGYVRLLESAKDERSQFKSIFLSFRPHSNAVIDMTFSLDDSLLATASGDQTARVVDMSTQRTVSVLSQHSASLKQVKFQPGVANNSIIATSSRDGSVQIWDLRCKGTEGPVQDIHVSMDPSSVPTIRSRVATPSYGCIVNSIYDAHRPSLHGRVGHSAIARDGPSRGELPGRIGDVSVTAITFLPEGQEHLLLTASEANAAIKLWDVRSLHRTRRRAALPLSCTALPESHNQWRHFGINSLNISGNGSRIYALCRDNIVYAYSTAHLVLGQASELSTNATWGRHQQGDVREGLGPLYGLRHRQLHATSFYVKAAIRPATADHAELLAVGSCDGCTILFPTDERYIETCWDPSYQGLNTPSRLRRNGSSIRVSSQPKDSIPISEKGTPLIRGHEREVGALTWTSDGELVTIGDDFLVRCWREGSLARALRTGGEEGGQRWGCGWADIPESFDDDKEDEEG